MKKGFFFSVLIVALMFSVVSVSAKDIKKGDTATVPGWKWVDVKNPDPIPQKFSNTTSLIGSGETCGIEQGGTVTVIGIDGNRLLVRYTAPGNPMGTPCPTGVVFFVTKEEFSKMTQKYKATKKAQDKERALVEKLLESE